MDRETRARLERAFDGWRIVAFDPTADLPMLVGEGSRVAVAGGDGTIHFVIRALAGTGATLGVLGLGTYNNFARALRLPEDVEESIDVALNGRPAPVTIGRVNGHAFVEAAMLGLFGEAIALGETVKERAFGEVGEELKLILEGSAFNYHVSGDVTRQGKAMSLVVANTPTTGAHLPLGEKVPDEPALELLPTVGATRLDLLGRLMMAAVGAGDSMAEPGLRFRSIRVETDPVVEIYADGEHAGRTPAEFTAEVGAVAVMVPWSRSASG